MTLSILVPVAAYSSVVSRKLNRLAQKCGVEFTEVPGKSYLFRLDADGNVTQSRVIECARLTVGDMPSVNGYSLLGKLTHTDAGNVISMAPNAHGFVTPEEWRTCSATCDHCRKPRGRLETFIVRCPDGSVLRVGRNCLADFLQADASGLVALDAFQDVIHQLRDEDALERSGAGHVEVAATLHFIACAVSSVEKLGFIKSGNDGSTSNHAYSLCMPRPGHYRAAEQWDAFQPTAAHLERAADIIAWLKSEKEDRSDYMSNLKIAAANTGAVGTFLGLLASAPSAYNRAMGRAAERAQRAARPDAGHIGSVGERIEFTAAITFVKALESDWGTKLLVSMRTPEGHELVTFTTGTGVSSNDCGKTFNVRGTVKKLGDYNGKAQTTLSRCAFKES